jgi:hypothetical protein
LQHRGHAAPSRRKDLKAPKNISLPPLLPRAPELNPQENIWQFMRANWLPNRIKLFTKSSITATRGTRSSINPGNHVHRSPRLGSRRSLIVEARRSPPRRRLPPKKAQRLAHRQNQRRDKNWYGAPSWREVRVDDWAARGYAPRESNYQRGGYGQGFVQNFW